MKPLAAADDEIRAGVGAGADAPRSRSPLKFFLLVLALSVPFWWIGAVTDLQLMPGHSISALGAFCPMVAALILVHRKDKTAGVTDLLRRSFDFKRIESKRWFALILLLIPCVSAAVYALMRWMDMPVPALQFSPLAALLMLLAFFVPLTLLHRSTTWIAWWCLYAVAARILMVWLYNNTGKSVFAVALFHATLNLSYMLFPLYGSHFDMRLGGLVMAFAAVIVTVIWGPRTLARFSPPAGAAR